MDAIVRGLMVYLFLLILFRIAGRRTLGNITNFDFVLLLIISEATQNAMIGNDYSVTNGFLVIEKITFGIYKFTVSEKPVFHAGFCGPGIIQISSSCTNIYPNRKTAPVVVTHN